MQRSVLILGGGIAGLTAAAELLAHNWRVTIVEAKSRLGGRVHTIHDGSTPIELGAEFVHGNDPALGDLIRKAGLSTHNVCDENRWFKDGRLESIGLWERVGETMHRIDPRRDDEPFATFTARELKNKNDREMALGFVQGFNAADPGRISAHALLRSEVSSERSSGSKQSRIARGYGALVDWLTSKVRDKGGVIRTGAVAHAVHRKSGEVDVFTERERLTADTTLITLPLGVLKKGTLSFKPALPRKAEAIAALEFGNVRRVTLVFREMWWPKHDFGFIHSFADVLPTWWSDPRGPILTGWAGGPKADALVERSADELKKLSLEILSKVFGEKRAALNDRLLSVHTHDWAGDPHIRGAYSYIPVRGLDLPKVLAEPVENTLFFAGEATATDAQMGTVFGAVESSRRVVSQMIAA